MEILGGAKRRQHNPVADDSPGETKTSLSELESSHYPRYKNVVQTKRTLKEDRTPLETPVVALGDLTDSHRQLAAKMLTEVTESFFQNEDHVGCI